MTIKQNTQHSTGPGAGEGVEGRWGVAGRLVVDTWTCADHIWQCQEDGISVVTAVLSTYARYKDVPTG